MSDNPQSSSVLRKALKRLAFVAGCGGVLVFIALAALILSDQSRVVPEPAAPVLDGFILGGAMANKVPAKQNAAAAANATMETATANSADNATSDVKNANAEAPYPQPSSGPQPVSQILTWQDFSSRYRITINTAKLPQAAQEKYRKQLHAMDDLTSQLLVLARAAETNGVTRELYEKVRHNQEEFDHLEYLLYNHDGPPFPVNDHDYDLARRKIAKWILLPGCVTEEDYSYAAWLSCDEGSLSGPGWDSVVYYARKGGWEGRKWLVCVSFCRPFIRIMRQIEKRQNEPPEGSPAG